LHARGDEHHALEGGGGTKRGMRLQVNRRAKRKSKKYEQASIKTMGWKRAEDSVWSFWEFAIGEHLKGRN